MARSHAPRVFVPLNPHQQAGGDIFPHGQLALPLSQVERRGRLNTRSSSSPGQTSGQSSGRGQGPSWDWASIFSSLQWESQEVQPTELLCSEPGHCLSRAWRCCWLDKCRNEGQAELVFGARWAWPGQTLTKGHFWASKEVVRWALFVALNPGKAAVISSF